jgi:Protein of unknown function (DUF3565)
MQEQKASKMIASAFGRIIDRCVMKPTEPQSLPRKIVSFRRDEQSDWIADLECGHQQYVRHNPPWTERHWVTTAGGRQAHIGQELLCSACTMTIHGRPWRGFERAVSNGRRTMLEQAPKLLKAFPEVKS